MVFSFLHMLKKTWRGLQNPRLLFFTLAYLMALLVVGTAAQKEIGLFQATHQFFNSFVYWWGPVPLPAGASILTVLFINLAVHFFTHSQWHRQQFGITLAHLSVLVLLFGGGVTLFAKTEGFMILRQNETTQNLYDYHLRHFNVMRNGKTIYRAGQDVLQAGRVLQSRNLPFTVSMLQACANCSVAENGTQLTPLKKNLDDETSQMGIVFMVDTGAARKMRFATAEFDNTPKTLSIGKDVYSFVLRRKTTTLPFTMLLEHLAQDYYPNTDIAQNYASSLSVTENHHAWPVLISMNNPFRYKGYTFYQSSVLTLPGETASVLNVVDNAGWLFPYIATGLLFLGLGFHVWVRYGRR